MLKNKTTTTRKKLQIKDKQIWQKKRHTTNKLAKKKEQKYQSH